MVRYRRLENVPRLRYINVSVMYYVYGASRPSLLSRLYDNIQIILPNHMHTSACVHRTWPWTRLLNTLHLSQLPHLLKVAGE